MTILLINLHRSIAQTYPNGFSQTTISGLNLPTAMAFAPDGRIFICQQTGAIRIVKNNALIATPAITILVGAGSERGLLGLAFDPNFNSNGFIYVYYTTSFSPVRNRICRFTVVGDIINASSEVLLMDLDNLSTATNHNGGSMQFGPDGKLYIAVGENAVPNNAQLITNRHGKILRINSDGSIPIDNPMSFSGITGSPTGANRAIWSVGLRNPYTIAFQPITGKLFVNDVGQSAKEEINESTSSGLNFGWPGTEGIFNPIIFPNYTLPIYDYGRSGAANTMGLGCAITGGTFFNPNSTNYGAEYIGNYFFLDLCGRWIDRLVLSPNPTGKVLADVWTRTTFASTISAQPVGLTTGNDGNLYYLSRSAGSLVKIESSNPLPVTLSNFYSEHIDNQLVKIIWESSLETNLSHFEVQKSYDSRKWETIGQVKAGQFSDEKNRYEFSDISPKIGINYYKLKIVDIDGKFTFSKIISEISTNILDNIAVYPNPGTDEIIIENDVAVLSQIQIVNLSGINFTENIKISKMGTRKHILNIGLLPKGKYVLKIGKSSKSIVKN